jgi:hypothetical protein
VIGHARSQAHELAPCLSLLGTVATPLSTEEGFQERRAKLLRARTPAELGAAAAAALEQIPALEAAVSDGAAYLQELGAQLLATQRACEAFSTRAHKLAQQAVELADGMDFDFLYDDQRALFSIGYNVSSARLDGSH